MKAPARALAILLVCFSLTLSAAVPVHTGALVPDSAVPADAGGSIPAPETPQLPPGASGDWWTTVQDDIRASEYAVTWQEQAILPGAAKTGPHSGAYQAPNRSQNLRTYFVEDGIRVIPRVYEGDQPPWTWALRLVSVNGHAVESGRLSANGRRVEYARGTLTEWYVNDESGLEQGFTLSIAPPGAPGGTRGISLELAPSDGLSAEVTADDGVLELRTVGGMRVLRYADLLAVDATGRILPAQLALSDGAVVLRVDDTDALYPVIVDPVLTASSSTPNWTAGGGQEDAHFGGSVGAAGDVNGDGYADVIVGAYLYDNGQPDEGRAFVYYGGQDGLSPVAGWTAEGDQESAWFGCSVGTAGDVNGDGYADVIIGARQYDDGQADEGAAFVYLGSVSGLGASGTPGNATWFAESNQAGANFGGSVGTAGDVNGDGFADLIIGAPYYDNGQVDEGAAFVYLGSASGLGVSGTPDNAAWSAESDQESAYFGNSVGTAGDVNADGYGDVIAGAYQFENGQTDEGRVYLYQGSAAGLSTLAAWTAESDQEHAWFGYCVGTAGDVNGDGYADLVVGANQYDHGEIDEGAVFVYLGSASGLSEPGTPGNAAWMAESDQESANFGISVGTAGDMNGDGYADVVAGASTYDHGEVDEGLAFVYLGSANGLGATEPLAAESDQGSANFGWSVATAGDVNGDGYSDLIVGACRYVDSHPGEGRAFVYHGGPRNPSAIAAWMVSGDQAGAYFGVSVATAGDVNGDGYADVIAGANLYDGGEEDEGRAFVFLGSASGLSTSAAWTADGGLAGAQFGISVATAGDVNGDGYSDVIAGADQYTNGEAHEGRAYVYTGGPSGLSTSPAWSAEGDRTSAYFGRSVGTAGDVNGDGYGDVIVGAAYYDNDLAREGRAYVYHGSATGLSTTAAWIAEGDQEYALFGISVGSAGDVNGDGYADVIVGAEWYDDGQSNEGRASVYAGGAGGLGASPLWTAESNQAGAYFGISVGTAGDVNGDGYADVIVGAPYYSNGEAEGRAYVYYGSANGPSATADWTAESDQNSANFGWSVATAGDVNGDGYSDVIVGAPYYDNGETDGRAYGYYGSAGGPNSAYGWMLSSDQAYAEFGRSVGTAGDVNGDGYADVIVGAYSYGQEYEGRAYVYYGNGGNGVALRLQQRRADDSAPVAPGGQAISPAQVRLAALARTPFGRSEVALQWQVKPVGTAFDLSGLEQSAWVDGGTTRASLNQLITSLILETRYHWRVRIIGRPPGLGTNRAVTYHSRWLYGSTFLTALSGTQTVAGAGRTNLLGQAGYVDLTSLGAPALTSLTLRGYPDTLPPHYTGILSYSPGARVLSRYFSVVPNSGAAGFLLTLCLNYDDSEVAAAGAAEANLQLCRWTGSAWSCPARATSSDVTANLVCAGGVTELSNWAIAITAPCSSTTLGIAIADSRVRLIWPGAATDVYRDGIPYFTPVAPYRTSIISPWTDPSGGVGNSGVNYTYLLQAPGCGAPSSQRVGEFDFALTKGQ